MPNIAKIIKGEDRTIPLQVQNGSGDPFDISSITNIAVRFPTQDGYLEKLLNDRAQKSIIKIESVVASVDYVATINSTDFTHPSGLTPTVATIIAGLKALINAGGEPVTANDAFEGDELDLDADVAGTGGEFTVVVSTDRMSRVTEDSAADKGSKPITIDQATAGKYSVPLDDSQTEILSEGDSQAFEVILDFGSDRRIVQYDGLLTVKAKIFT